MNADPEIPWHRQVPDGIDPDLTAELNRRARWQRRRAALLEHGLLLPLVAVLLLLTGFGLGLLWAACFPP